jgi:aldehyde:ferredoxin oxidoreductase
MQPILKINLSTRDIGSFEIPIAWQHEYLGGASLGARILYENLEIDLDPLSPDAPLLFLNGPLSGTAGPSVGRFVVVGRSPATRLWGESNCGGFWGPELRMAGFDGVLITGKADEPVMIVIEDQDIQILPASDLWGMDTYSTQAAVEARNGNKKMRVAVIGPGGERLIPYASILTDHGRLAGRTGMGAIMGSKNLKAIAVKGHGDVPVYNKEVYNQLRSAANQMLRDESESQVARQLGTACLADYFDYLGEMPKRYFQTGVFEKAGNISGSTIAESILAGVSACHACVIACGRVVRLADGEKRKGPEYETLVGFGPNLLLADPVLATRLGELCDRYGIDTISVSNTLGFAFSLFEKGVITEKETDGLILQWGKGETLETLIHLIGKREGFGEFLSEGAQALGRRYGMEEEAVQVNGLEVAYHDPRGSSGMALVYATSPRGACHNQSDYFFVDIGHVENSLGMEYYSRLGGKEKARNVAIHQDWRTVFNSLVMCTFANLPPETILDLINAACDLNWTIQDMLRCGERAWNLKRVINNRLGLTRVNDKLPKPLMRPLLDAPEEMKGFIPDIEAMLETYYQVRGWDPATGKPTPDKLKLLGLEWVIPNLWTSELEEGYK